MLTFLESVGRRSEAEFYLRMFHGLPKESFAIIVPGGPVVRSALGSIVEQLRFLSDLGLYATVVLGLFDPDTGAKLGADEKQIGSGAVSEVQDKFAIITFTGKAAAKDTVRKK